MVKGKQVQSSAAATAPATTITKASSDAPKRFVNTQRTLVFASRGILASHRVLMNDMRSLLPHSKKEGKLDVEKNDYTHVNIVCKQKKCSNCLFFESKNKGKELYCYVLKSPIGPTIKFSLDSVSTMNELRLTGNCLKYSRPILHFDSNFEKEPHLQLIKEVFTQVFASPKGHPKTKPFTDHILSFYYLDGRIWFRNYQIVDRVTGADAKMSLAEIGPRFTMNPIRILSGAFDGEVLYNNDVYLSNREKLRRKAQIIVANKTAKKMNAVHRREYMDDMKRDEVASVWYEDREPKQEEDDDDDEDDDEVSEQPGSNNTSMQEEEDDEDDE